jgi:hypothetical protein
MVGTITSGGTWLQPPLPEFLLAVGGGVLVLFVFGLMTKGRA